ncbi:MAG: SoxR reducing system RseC family protein [Deltaproteobacteria bacterium]|jgi:sigma-E factor negative regulatory protein RseC
MISEQGIVERVKGKRVLVRIERTSACATCESRGSCEMGPDKKMMVEVANDLAAKTGDRVEVSIPSGSLLKLGFLVYLLPIVALIAGAYAGEALAPLFSIHPTAAAIVCGGLGTGLVFAGLRVLDRRFQISGQACPRMTRILVRGL